jgi:hypothetical protein
VRNMERVNTQQKKYDISSGVHNEINTYSMVQDII